MNVGLTTHKVVDNNSPFRRSNRDGGCDTLFLTTVDNSFNASTSMASWILFEPKQMWKQGFYAKTVVCLLVDVFDWHKMCSSVCPGIDSLASLCSSGVDGLVEHL